MSAPVSRLAPPRCRGRGRVRAAAVVCLAAGVLGAGAAPPAAVESTRDTQAGGVAGPAATAVTVVRRLAAAGLPVTRVVLCVAAPGPRSPVAAAYGGPRPAAAAVFADRRLGRVREPRRVSDGGVVEVFDTAGQVRERQRQVAAELLAAQRFGFDEGGQPLPTEHQFSSGPVLLRVAGELDTTQARAYASALTAATRSAGDGVARAVKEAACST